jgi:hypothetical protein
MTCLDRTGADSVYERLREHVAASESSVHDIFTCSDALINELGHEPSDAQEVAALCRPALPLYCITPMLHVHPCISSQLWRESTPRPRMYQLWQSCIDGYRRVATADRYETDILHGSIDAGFRVALFGTEHNALLPVLRLANLSTNRTYAVKFVMHYVTMVTLQYYTMQREQWLESCEDSRQVFSDKRPPHVCMLFLRYDIKADYFPIDLTQTSLKDAAEKYDFSSLLCAVLLALLDQINQHMPKALMRKADVLAWINDKVFVTKTQLLVTSRFVLMHIQDFSKHILQSLRLDNTPSSGGIVSDRMTKHYLLPTHHRMKQTHFVGTDPLSNSSLHHKFDINNGDSMRLAMNQCRIPALLCHLVFSPVESIGAFDTEMQRFAGLTVAQCTTEELKQGRDLWLHSTLHQATRVMDSSLAGRLLKTINQERGKLKLKDKLKMSQLSQHVHKHMSLVRLRHCFTLIKHRLYTRVADLLRVPAMAETSPMFISRPAWKWLTHHDPLKRSHAARSAFDSRYLSVSPQRGFVKMLPPCTGLVRDSEYELYMSESWRLPASSFEYMCVYHAALVTKWLQPFAAHSSRHSQPVHSQPSHSQQGPSLQSQSQPGHCGIQINAWLLLHGLICILESEREACLEATRLLQLSDPVAFDSLDSVLAEIQTHHNDFASQSRKHMLRIARLDVKVHHDIDQMSRDWRHSASSRHSTHLPSRRIVTPEILAKATMHALGEITMFAFDEDDVMQPVPDPDAQLCEDNSAEHLEFREWLTQVCTLCVSSSVETSTASHPDSSDSPLMRRLQHGSIQCANMGTFQLHKLRLGMRNMRECIEIAYDAYCKMCLPLEHIRATEDTTWRDLRDFETHTPEISTMLHSLVTQLRSDKFANELQKLSTRVMHHKTQSLHGIAKHTLDACHHVLLAMQKLNMEHQHQSRNTHNSETDASNALISTISNLCTYDMDLTAQPVACAQKECIRRAKQMFLLDTTLLGVEIERAIETAIRSLGAHFELHELPRHAFDVMFCGPRQLSLRVAKLFESADTRLPRAFKAQFTVRDSPLRAQLELVLPNALSL